MSLPILSIVIANYNYGRFLEEAIQSVLSQSCQDFELIICDAASTDNSVDVIKKYETQIAWWCSEKDGGQSAAFNKGFSHARGRFLTWLNADDVMLPGVVEKLKVAAERFPSCEWFVGGVLWLDSKMRMFNCGRGRSFSEIRYREGNVNVWGPSSFFTKRLLTAVGGVDERFRYMMDTDLWLRFAYQEKVRYRPFCDYAWGLRLHPDAKMSGHNFTSEGEWDPSTAEKAGSIDEKKARQFEAERMWTQQVTFKPRRSTLMSRILSASWWNVLMAKVDLMRFKGRYYREIFK